MELREGDIVHVRMEVIRVDNGYIDVSKPGDPDTTTVTADDIVKVERRAIQPGDQASIPGVGRVYVISFDRDSAWVRPLHLRLPNEYLTVLRSSLEPAYD